MATKPPPLVNTSDMNTRRKVGISDPGPRKGEIPGRPEYAQLAGKEPATYAAYLRDAAACMGLAESRGRYWMPSHLPPPEKQKHWATLRLRQINQHLALAQANTPPMLPV